MVMSWLIITEKDDAARRIANILFKDVVVLKEGKINYYYSEENDAYVVGLKGHIIELDFPKELKNWLKTPLNELLNAELVKKVKERTIYNLIKKIAKEVDRVTIATDYDREGELIGVEALEILKSINPNIKVDRARYSAITKEEITKAFAKTTNVDFNLAKAALVRQKIDLVWGAALTRMISIHSGRLGKDFLSVGRVQTPTLRIIVEREEEIRNFRPEKYYEISAKFESFEAKHPKKYKERSEAEKVFSSIGDFGVVKSFTRKSIEEAKPIPFNTTEFLREASKFMSPYKAMQVAEFLYMNGYISYPRTDNTVYPKSIDLLGIARSFLNSPFAKEAKIVLSQEKIEASSGKKESKDHPPIYPTAVATRKDLKDDEWIIYELIVRRFLATLAPKAVWDIRKAEIDCNGVNFIANGRKIVSAGWREIYIYSKAEEVELPILKVGQKIRLIEKKLEEKKTKPPARFSASALIKLMENLGLGTKSTRHEIIKKLVSRGYISGNPFSPSETAFSVINVLKKVAETITLPDMTAKLEKEMDEVAEGKKREEEVFEDSKKMLESILSKIDYSKLASELRDGIKRDKVVGKCPECGADIVVRKSKNKKRFLGCTNYPKCTFTLPLPQKGTIVLTKKVCQKHAIREIKIKDKKTWNLGCPYCNYIEWKKAQDCSPDSKLNSSSKA